MFPIVRSLLPCRCLLAMLLFQRAKGRLLLVMLLISTRMSVVCLLGHRLHQQMRDLFASIGLCSLLSYLLQRLV